MIDTNAQRAECARMEAMLAEFNDGYEFRTTPEHFDFVKIARADWPALIKAHQEAMDEIDTLRGAMAADDERLRKAGERVGIDQGCDTAEWMADEIERLRADVAARMPDPVPANDPELHELYDVWKG